MADVEAVGLLNDELRAALQHISGKTIEGSFQTTAEMLHAFNSAYICKTAFDVMGAEGAPLKDAVIAVKNGDTVIEPQSDGRYALEAGTYAYDCTCEGYTDITGTSFTISASDVTRGSKSVTVTMTAVAEG